MAQALLDVSLGNGFSMQIFSQDLHLSGRSQPVMQFRVRDTQRVRVWTFRVQLTDAVSGGSNREAHDHPFLSAARRAPSTEQYWFEADLSGERTVVVGDATRPQMRGAPRPPQTVGALRPPAQTVGAPRPPALRPPAHLVRPGTVLRPQLPVRPCTRSEARPAPSDVITGALRSRERSRSAGVGSSSEYDQARIAADLVDTGALPATGDMNASQPRGPKPGRRDRGRGRGAGR